MSRAQKISEKGIVLDDAEVSRHWPFRPRWTCDAGCGDWPCFKLREHMRASMPAMEISMVMANYYDDAMRELELPLGEVHRRMFGWINGPTPPAPVQVRRPPGGPWYTR